MNEENKWLLMTYYCPTHGDSGMSKTVELSKKQISQIFLKKGKSSKN